MTAGRSVVVAAATVSMLGTLAVWITSALSVPELMGDDLGLTDARLGVAVSSYFVLSAVIAWVGGGLSDRIGARATLTLGAATSLAAIAGLGLLARDWTHVVALLMLAGVGSAIIQPATNHAIVRGVRLGRHGLAIGLKQASVPAATLLAGASLPLVAETLGWRWAFAVPALLAVAFVALRGRLPDGRRPGARLVDGAGDGAGRLPLVVLSAVGGLGVAAISAATAFLVRHLVVEGTSAGTAGWVLAVASLAGVVVRVLGGWRADAMVGSPQRLVVALLGLGALGAAGLAVAEGTPALTLAAIVLVGAGWGWNGLLVLTIVRAYPDTPGLATGISQIGIRGGGAVGPSAFGFVVAGAGFAAGWLVVAATLAAAAGLMLLGGRLLPDARRAASEVGGVAGAR